MTTDKIIDSSLQRAAIDLAGQDVTPYHKVAITRLLRVVPHSFLAKAKRQWLITRNVRNAFITLLGQGTEM